MQVNYTGHIQYRSKDLFTLVKETFKTNLAS